MKHNKIIWLHEIEEEVPAWKIALLFVILAGFILLAGLQPAIHYVH